MKILSKPWMTEREYRANREGLNIVFGAVLGFVLAGAENLDAYDYALFLLMSAGAVISILYISASRRRVLYFTLALVYAVLLPLLLELALEDVPAKLLPTLVIWTLIAGGVEFAPRERPLGER